MLTVLSCAISVRGVHAQEASQAAASDSDADLHEVIVTAQGRPQNQADVPLSITSFSNRDLERWDVHDLSDLSSHTPGMLVDTQYPSTPTIVIRGISTNTPDITAEPRVSIFQDGIYASRPQGALFELFDEERVEVVKGPQSTLYGRSALAGAINIVQHKAELDESEATANVEFGDYDQRVAQAGANVPLGDHAALRVAFIDRDNGGYSDNLAGGQTLNAQRTQAGRVAFRAESSAGTTLDVILNAQHDAYSEPSFKSGVFLPIDPATGRAIGNLSPYSSADLSTASDFVLGPAGGSRNIEGASALLTVPISDSLALKSITGVTHFHTLIVADYDASALNLATSGEDASDRQFSQELRVAYTPDGPLKLFTGASLADDHGSQRVPIEIDERELLGLDTGLINRTNPQLLPLTVYDSTQTVAAELQGVASAYGAALAPGLAQAIAANLSPAHREELTRADQNRYYDLFEEANLTLSPQWQLEGGIRYSWADKRSSLTEVIDERSILAGFLGALTQPAAVRNGLLGLLAAPGASRIPTSMNYPLPFFGILEQPTATAAGDAASLTDGGASYRASALYALSSASNLYFTYARGRLPEVLSAEAPLTPGGPSQFTRLAPETADSIELGTKNRAWDGRLQIDAAIYGFNYQHFQTELLQGTTLVETDAGKANVYGLEASGKLAAASWADFSVAYAYTHARFGSGLYDGNHFRLAPDDTVSIDADLHTAVPGGVVSLIPHYSWRSRVYFDDSNGKLALLPASFLPPIPYQASQGAVQLVDLHLGFAPQRGAWRTEVFVRNLFDERYISDVGAGSLSIGLPSYIAGPPRMVGAAFSVRF